MLTEYVRSTIANHHRAASFYAFSQRHCSSRRHNNSKIALAMLYMALVNSPFCSAETYSSDNAYQLSATYTADFFHNVEGGIKTGSAYLDDFNLTLEIDAEKAWGVQGLNLLASVIYNNGADLSSEFIGDDQGSSSIETVSATRVFELWAQWRYGQRNNQSVLFGLYDLNAEFDVIPSAGLFVSSSHGIGRDFSQTGQNGPSIFPVTSLALRYQWQIDSRWQWQAALLDGVPGDPDAPDRTPIKLSKNDGALLTTEFIRETPRLRKLALGLWHYTAAFEQFNQPNNSRDNNGAYALADITLLPSAQPLSLASPAKLSAFFRYGIANKDINRFGQYAGAGLVLRDVLPADTDSELGLAVSHARNGKPWEKHQHDSAKTTDSHETIVELTLKTQVQHWLSLQPTLQYIVNPNTDPQLNNALALGLRFEISL